MSLRNLPVAKDHTIILDGKKTNIPAYSRETIAVLNWQEYLNNRTGQYHKEPERSKEYF